MKNKGKNKSNNKQKVIETEKQKESGAKERRNRQT